MGTGVMYMPGSWSHQDWCPTPSGHDGDCWMENNRVRGIKPIPDGEPVIDIIDAKDYCWKCGEKMDPLETRADDGGHYGDCRDPYEVYGTPEHEAWLIEMEAREG